MNDWRHVEKQGQGVQCNVHHQLAIMLKSNINNQLAIMLKSNINCQLAPPAGCLNPYSGSAVRLPTRADRPYRPSVRLCAPSHGFNTSVTLEQTLSERRGDPTHSVWKCVHF